MLRSKPSSRPRAKSRSFRQSAVTGRNSTSSSSILTQSSFLPTQLAPNASSFTSSHHSFERGIAPSRARSHSCSQRQSSAVVRKHQYHHHASREGTVDDMMRNVLTSHGPTHSVSRFEPDDKMDSHDIISLHKIHPPSIPHARVIPVHHAPSSIHLPFKPVHQINKGFSLSPHLPIHMPMDITPTHHRSFSSIPPMAAITQHDHIISHEVITPVPYVKKRKPRATKASPALEPAPVILVDTTNLESPEVAIEGEQKPHISITKTTSQTDDHEVTTISIKVVRPRQLDSIVVDHKEETNTSTNTAEEQPSQHDKESTPVNQTDTTTAAPHAKGSKSKLQEVTKVANSAQITESQPVEAQPVQQQIVPETPVEVQAGSARRSLSLKGRKTASSSADSPGIPSDTHNTTPDVPPPKLSSTKTDSKSKIDTSPSPPPPSPGASVPVEQEEIKPQTKSEKKTKTAIRDGNADEILDAKGEAATEDDDDDVSQSTAAGTTSSGGDLEIKELTTSDHIDALVKKAQTEFIETIPPPDTTIVQDKESALKVLEILNRPDVRNRYHACDTETMGIDPKVQSPVGNGTVICLSIYVGPDVDFGTGSRIWIDNFGKSQGVMNYFKDYLEDESIKKVWHNYSFDRHVIYNHGINVKGFGGDTMHMARLWNSGRTGEGGNYSLESLSKDLVTEIPHKESMNKRFAYYRPLKNGEVAKVATVPGTLELQLSPDYRTEWIDYSVRDAQATWYLRERLEKELRQWPWTSGHTMFEFYQRYWLHFGEMLTDMEREGIYVLRKDYLPKAREQAEKDKKVCEDKFLEWAIKQREECKYMNPSSEQQKQQLLFGPLDEKDVHKSGLDPSRVFETENTFNYIEPGKDKPKKKFQFSIRGLGMPIIARTPKGKPQVNIEVIKALAGNPFANPPKYGQAYDFFGKGDQGKEACESLYQLVKLAGIDITISTFIDPLTELPDAKDRVHCSLNLNTETGRLSARKPNLQNQPALDKDIYKIRAAFSAEPGNSLVVADYGQLELRILAHIAKCKSMLEAFKLGGDFHSRTAMGMYPHVADAVKKGEVLLEWDFTQGANPKPLLKDKFSNERKKAKILNFSIAYGKTVRGLASDWGVSLEEAKQTVDAWYSDRPEVLNWQKKTIAEARKTGVTRTIMGRYRPVHGINDPSGRVRGHAERMAINTPIQGGAADVVMAGMLKLHRNEELRELGWRCLLQIHDELIVEGPEEHEKRALEIVNECMSHPFKNDLLVDLVVDANIAKTWYEGK